MRRFTKLLLLCLLLSLTLVTSGCLMSKLGPKFTQPMIVPQDKAVIYVYRSRAGITASDVPGIRINDTQVVKGLPEISYFPIAVTPGSYTLTPKLLGIYKTTPVTINARAGETYFVEFRVQIGHLRFALKNPDEAKAYMATCYMIDPGFASDPRVMVGARAANQSKPVAAAKATPAPAAAKPASQAIQPTAQAPAKVTTSQLFVEPTPTTARIRIMNIGPKFKQGITLQAGRYHVEVSAPGHSTYLKWITLQAGETRRLKVALKAMPVEPVKVAEALKQIQPKTKKKDVKPAKVKTAAVRTVPVPANLSADEKRYAQMLQASSAIDIRNAAKNLYYHHANSSYLAQVAEQTLLQRYQQNSSDNMHVDAMAWLCKALAATHDSRYKTTLTTVAQSAPNRKLRSYAQKSLNLL